MDEGQFFGQVKIHDDLRGLELVLQQGERVTDDLVQICLPELCGRGAGEVEQSVGNFCGAEALLRDLVHHRSQARIAMQLF